MKTLKLLLVFAIFSYCFTDAIDCEHEFEELLKQKCNEIPSCSYNPNDPSNRCVQTHDCNTATSSTDCLRSNPSNYLTHKCEYVTSATGTSGVCQPTQRLCEDYSNNGIIGDDCTLLSAKYPDKQRCILTYSSSPTKCKGHYNKCEDVDISGTDAANNCNNNIPTNFKEKCNYNSGTSPSCGKVDRYCSNGDETFVNYFGKEKCSQLSLPGDETEKSKKKCLYNGNRCEERYKKCQYQSGLYNCNNYIPLKDDESDYNYTAICEYNYDSSICEARKRKCSEYTAIPTKLLNEATCDELETSQTYYRCAYNEKDQKCEEQYDGCDKYITNKVETDRNDCEKIVLRDKTKKCVYIQKEDKCITKDIYSKCGDYLGNDKKICESILSSDNNQYCILDKDTNCTEKPINCTEAHGDKEKCLKIAKSTENNKRCAYKSGKCYDEYLRCEDYLGDDYSECRSINLYDGKKCEWETISGTIGTQRCRSSFKTCDDATTKEECKLIFKTGVTDPERRVCDWNENTNKCFENYKYCSDYRGTSTSFCAGIKPYDESGDNVDIGFKCSLHETDVGCQKIPVKCEDAKDSRSLCESYSQYIKDSDKKFCVYNSGLTSGQRCYSQYRKCEYIQHPQEIGSCPGNIIEGYIKDACTVKDSKCVTKSEHDDNICMNLASTYNLNKDYFVKRINPNCSIPSSTSKFEYKENTCSQVTFYTNSTENKDICENMIPSLPYKKCTLKEDGSSCEEVYKEFNFSTAGISYSRAPDNTSQENSSHFIKKGIHLMMALICLLI
jgi:hypothetical protein